MTGMPNGTAQFLRRISALASGLQVTNGGQNSAPANQMSVIEMLRQP